VKVRKVCVWKLRAQRNEGDEKARSRSAGRGRALTSSPRPPHHLGHTQPSLPSQCHKHTRHSRYVAKQSDVSYSHRRLLTRFVLQSLHSSGSAFTPLIATSSLPLLAGVTLSAAFVSTFYFTT
jgi:hypothetical protein